MQKLAVSLFFVLLVLVSSAFACSCLPPGSPSQELARSAAVFTGTVVSVDQTDDHQINSVYVDFEVSAYWKGEVFEQMTVRTSPHSASCGFSFEELDDYLVYATEAQGDYFVSLCSRTAKMLPESTDLAFLGQGTIPQERPVDAERPILSVILFIAIVAVLIVVFSKFIVR